MQFARIPLVLIALSIGFPPSGVQAQIAPNIPRISITERSDLANGGATELTAPAIASAGSSLSLTANINGSQPLAFQWLLNGAALQGATNPVYTLQTLERSDEGSYSVVVTNGVGSSSSDPARLLVSNIKPFHYVSFAVDSITNGVGQIQYADSLRTNEVWRSLAGVTSSVAPLVIVDPAPVAVNQRFYRASQTNTLKAWLAPGWTYSDPIGSVYLIEFIAPEVGETNWQALQTLTIPRTPYLFVDTTATNGQPRRYRSTLLASPSILRVGTLVSTITWTLPSAVYTNLTRANRREFAVLGISLNDQEKALEFPTNPVPGNWVIVGDQRVMTGTNGSFQINVPAGTTNGFVARSADGQLSQAEVTFDPRSLALPGQTSTPVLIRYRQEGILNMDAPRQSSLATKEAICGNPCAAIGNAKPCCLDYNGIFSDGCKYPDDSASFGEKLIRYIGSTCYRLVNQGLCRNEFNAQPANPIQFITGPVCFKNHKYRNCQNVDLNIDTAFTMSANATVVQCGKSIDITIHNNSPGNETEFYLEPLSWRNLGTLSGARVSSGWWPQSYLMRHYEDSQLIHYSDNTIHYTAPSKEDMDPSVNEMTVNITGRSGGIERRIQVTVSCDVTPIPNMVWIPPGTFLMGSPLSEADRDADETQHPVTLTRGYHIGKYEVTQAEYQSVMGFNPSFFSKGANLPVEMVWWDDAVSYCKELTARERTAGRLPQGYEYCLPTEAQWEYACRAGTTTATSFGDNLTSFMANFNGNPYPNGSIGPYLQKTTPVGHYRANAFGLYDMHGNIWEWCLDYYGEYPSGSVTDPAGPSSGDNRVIRGGSLISSGSDCRSAFRGWYFPGFRSFDLGFRVVLVRAQ